MTPPPTSAYTAPTVTTLHQYRYHHLAKRGHSLGINLPADWLRTLNWFPGDLLLLQITGDRLTVTRAKELLHAQPQHPANPP